MAHYQTPGVYVEEISTLPPSVAEVSTAIPAFIGYTEKGPAADQEPFVARVSTLLEYESLFGKAKPSAFTVTVGADPDAELDINRDTTTPDFMLYYCLSMYFKNGGGSCYVVSVGNYSDAVNTDHFAAGLTALEKEDEPTLILLTDAANLVGAAAYYGLCQQALDQCQKLKDRFTILDVVDGDADAFRGTENSPAVVVNNLMYGAAYLPYLNTSLAFQYNEDGVQIGAEAARTLDTIKSTETALYNKIKAAMSDNKVTLPPSAAVAGVYARVDRERGVWKAPANVGLTVVLGPASKITNREQDGLNVDPTAGKSINAIRAFTGKGTLIWGARTLAGNDNEWRYISVRRLFNMIEESTQKATSFAVFEPNDATTWLKVKGMIESYLYSLWERGALAGSAPEAAYYVNVGLGKTMNTQDILEGRMIVEIGVAAVRPAEFIIIRFMHKLQEA